MSELSQEARALIDSVSKLDDPSPDDRARVKQRVALSIGAAAFSAVAITELAGGTGPGVLGTLKAGLWSTTGKLALCAGVVGGALALGWPSGQTVPKTAGGRQQIASAELPLAAPAAQAREPVVADPPPDEAPSEPPELAASPAPERAPARARERAATERGQAAEPPSGAAEPQSTLALELALLGDAQAALRAGQPEQALALARKHHARFPAGVLRDERLGIETLSECMLGRKDPARTEGFLRAAPDSPLAARVRKACGPE
jgi:hypothetical protein